jgi:hypothetical protein
VNPSRSGLARFDNDDGSFNDVKCESASSASANQQHALSGVLDIYRLG